MYVCSTVGFFRSFVFIQGVLLFSCFDFAFFFLLVCLYCAVFFISHRALKSVFFCLAEHALIVIEKKKEKRNFGASFARVFLDLTQWLRPPPHHRSRQRSYRGAATRTAIAASPLFSPMAAASLFSRPSTGRSNYWPAVLP